MTPLRRFTEAGCRLFATRLEESKTVADVRFDDLVSSVVYTETLSAKGDVPTVDFSSRLEAAEATAQVFASVGLSEEARRDPNMWAWLSARWIDSLAPLDTSGLRAPGRIYRWIPDMTSWRTYYRHLLLGPYSIYLLHEGDPKVAMCVLGSRASRPGDTVEQLASRQEIVTNPNVLEVATALYWDSEGARMKRGAGGSGPGSPRRFADIYWQFDRTWDFHVATPATILELLPDEFDRFKA